MAFTDPRALPVLNVGNEISFEVWWVDPEYPGDNYLAVSCDSRNETRDFVGERPNYHIFKTTISRKEII